MLCYADIQQLHRIAQQYDCRRSHSKNELIQAILAKAYNRDVMEKQVTNFTIEDLRFMNSVLFERKKNFSLEELLAKAQETQFSRNKQRNPREMITEYRHRGWLFNGVTNENRYLFQFPADLKKRIGEVMLKQLSKKVQVAEEPEVYKDEQHLLAEDVQTFLCYIHRHDLPLTTAGYLYKRQLQQLLQTMTIEEPLVPKKAWRFGYGRRYKEYPDRFSLLYDYCYDNGWIYETSDRLLLTDRGEKQVLGEDKIDLSSMYRFWLRVYREPIPNIKAMVHWIEKLSSDWVTVQSITETLAQFIKPFYYDEVDHILHKRLLQMMLHLGLITLGEHSVHGAVMRSTDQGSHLIRTANI